MNLIVFVCKGTAFVKFSTSEEAQECIQAASSGRQGSHTEVAMVVCMLATLYASHTYVHEMFVIDHFCLSYRV